jgi:hypothetical protein
MAGSFEGRLSVFALVPLGRAGEVGFSVNCIGRGQAGQVAEYPVLREYRSFHALLRCVKPENIDV